MNSASVAAVPSVLVVDDEPVLSGTVKNYLERAGMSAQTCGDGLAALDLVRATAPDVVVLDLGLPGMDGVEVCRQLRTFSDCYVLMLTARADEVDKLIGLSVGADDYMPKPFSFEELLARIRVRLRPDATGPDQMRLTHRDMVLDLRTRTLTLEGRTVELSAREFALAETFMRHPGQVLSREQLLSAVWGLDFDPGSNVVEVYVSYLRNKLGRQRVETVRGMGYRLI